MLDKDDFEKKILRLAQKWTLKQCVYCDPGTLVSVDGMLDFKCINCGRTMKPELYLDELVNLVSKYREHMEVKDEF